MINKEIKSFVENFKIKKKSIFQFVKEGSYLSIAKFFNLILGIIFLKLLISYLNPDQLGRYSFSMTIFTFTNLILIGPFAASIKRFFPIAKEKRLLKSFIKSIAEGYLLMGIIFGIMSAFCCLILIFIGQFYFVKVLSLMIIISIIIGYNSFCYSIQNASREQKIYSIISTSESFIKILFCLWSLEILGRYAISVLIGVLATCLLFSLINTFFTLRILLIAEFSSSKEIQYNWKKKLIKYSWPFTSWGVFAWAANSSDKWALFYFDSPATAGLYSIIYQIGYLPIDYLSVIFSKTISPRLNQIVTDDEDITRIKKIHKYTIFLLKIAIFISFCSTILAVLFRKIMFSFFLNDYSQSLSFLIIFFVLASSFNFIKSIFSISLNALNLIEERIKVNIISHNIRVICCLLGGFYGSLSGVVLSFTLSHAFHMIWMYFVWNKNINLLIKNNSELSSQAM